MSFFNKKEEVYHIELTPYGKYLLSLGKLKPHHYRFFDDDVIYDSAFMLKTENQNDAHYRILEETPKIKPNGNLKGVLTNFKKTEGAKELTIGPSLKKLRLELNDSLIHKLPYPIGSFKYGEDTTPSIQADFFNGQISNSSKTYVIGADKGEEINIPQIDVDVEYVYTIKNSQDVATNVNSTNYEKTYYGETTDGKVLEMVPNIPLIRIKSEGTFDEIEDYDVEVFKAASGPSGYSYHKLKFSPKFNPVENGILKDPEDVPSYISTQDDPGTVEYFFDLVVDNEIPESVLCDTVGELKIRNIYLDKKIDCSDKDKVGEFSPYSSKVNIDDLKDC